MAPLPAGSDEPRDVPPEVRAIEHAFGDAVGDLHEAWDGLQNALARMLEGRDVGHPDLPTLQLRVRDAEQHAHDMTALAFTLHETRRS